MQAADIDTRQELDGRGLYPALGAVDGGTVAR
jgi:hypothetical protein